MIYDGEGSIRLLVRSISEVNGEEKRDRLTGLHGEGRFALDLGRLLQKKHGAGFLLLIGVDDFKEINEKYGIGIRRFAPAALSFCRLQRAGKISGICPE